MACLTKAGAHPKKTTEMGFAAPGGDIQVGSGANQLVVGVFPNEDYANAQANSVVSIASSFVGKQSAKANTHVVGRVVWFPAHSPFSGQHFKALDSCLA